MQDLKLTTTGSNSGSYHYDPTNQWSANRKQSFADMAEEIRDEEKERTYTEEDIIAVYQAAKAGFTLEEIFKALKEKK